MNDEEFIGNKVEIDTEYEKSRLEYRPVVEYNPQKKSVVGVEEPEVTTDIEDELSEDFFFEDERNPITQYEDFTYLLHEIQSMIKDIESSFHNTNIPVGEDFLDKFIEVFPELYKNADEAVINFDVYKESFMDPENPKNSLLQDIVSSYAEDVEGNLELEIYEDLKEMENNLLEVYHLFSNSVLDSYGVSEIPVSPENNPDFIDSLKEVILENREKHRALEERYDEREFEYYSSLREAYGTPEYFEALDKYEKAKRPYELSKKTNETTEEMSGLVDEALFGYSDLVGKIKVGLVLGSDIDEDEVLKVLNKQRSSKEGLDRMLKLSQLALKLRVNKQIEEKHQYRDVLKNINNLSRKQRAHDELLTAHNLKSQMYLEIYDTLRYFQSASRDTNLETFLDHLAGGLELVNDQYNSFLSDVYRMYLSENEIREEKIDKVLEKEEARASYHLTLSNR